jgi:hypothetical protein
MRALKHIVKQRYSIHTGQVATSGAGNDEELTNYQRNLSVLVQRVRGSQPQDDDDLLAPKRPESGLNIT